MRSGVIAALLSLVAAVTLAGCRATHPQTLVSSGDSIPLAYDACGLLKACPALSYASGGGPGVASLSRRIQQLDPKLTRVGSVARVGAMAADLPEQLRQAAGRRADLVTVMVGANDACAADPGSMTPVADFRASIHTAFGSFFRARPSAVAIVSAVPSLYAVWHLGSANPTARLVWQLGNICPSMLADPTSTAPADTARRASVQRRVDAYNRALRDECATFSGCRFSAAPARFPTALDQLSPYDFFHPSRIGQQTLADLTWQNYLT